MTRATATITKALQILVHLKTPAAQGFFHGAVGPDWPSVLKIKCIFLRRGYRWNTFQSLYTFCRPLEPELVPWFVCV